jgi:hypothetical protein
MSITEAVQQSMIENYGRPFPWMQQHQAPAMGAISGEAEGQTEDPQLEGVCARLCDHQT